jgi:hypothetical protein
MKKLNSIQIQNFKIFNQEVSIPIEGKHVLVWGVNGSGKSSIYWSLYTFLQCSGKAVGDEKKYFNKGEVSLHNIHAEPVLDSFIKLGFKAPGENEKFYELSSKKDETKDELIISVNSGSEFITHRLLLNFYNYRNSQKIDLFPIFYRDIFPYFNTPKGNSFQSILKNIEQSLNIETPSNLNAWVKEFNDGIEDLILSIRRGDASKFYNDNLSYKGEKIDIQIHFSELLEIIGSRGNRRIKEPVIRLQAKLKPDGNQETEIHRPQSFFNEARINAIALAIRFVLMQNRPPVNTVKFLVLDDLLISLDMQNRVKIIKLILSQFAEKYQLFIFTHDKGFYNEVLRQIESQKHFWQVIQLYEPQELGQNPEIRYEDEGYMAMADSAFLRRDFEACALYLRKETEAILIKFLDPEMELFWKQKDWISLADFITRTRKKLDTYATNDFARFVNQSITKEELELLKSDLGEPVDTAESKALIGRLNTYRQRLYSFIIAEKDLRINPIYEIVDDIKGIKDRVLNPGAHAGEVPFFKEEIAEAIEKVKLLKEKLDELT